MLGEVKGSAREKFLQGELVRYIPQLAGRTDQEIADFADYQRGVYLLGKMPEFGRPIASLNPTFVDSVDSIELTRKDHTIYTRASIKENGYRLQLHLSGVARAFTRQFTSYDLRMFPELQETFAKLPVMIGDAELINRRFTHLAGFNRVQLRIPNQTYWPRDGEVGHSQEFLDGYFSDPGLFLDGQSLPDTELTLCFHGLFAIAHPKTWNEPRRVQLENLISLCNLPVDYCRMDSLLDELAKFIEEKGLNARVVERIRMIDGISEELKTYVNKNEEAGYEGTCVVQTIRDRNGRLVVAPRSVKIKTYETLDCILLGLYLNRKEDGLAEENIKDALVGLYDESLGVYLPATKVNLDPNGVQIKTDGQRERLTALRRELSMIVENRIDNKRKVHTLYDAFLMQGKIVMKYIFGEEKASAVSFEDVLENLPSRSNLFDLYETFVSDRLAFVGGSAKLSTVPQKFVAKYVSFFQAIYELDKKAKDRFFNYFSKVKHVRTVSAKLVKPQIVVDTDMPIILETLVFDIKWGTSPCAAGFHSWFMNSFCLSNAFAERVRHDKSTTTDYGTVHALARVFTPRSSKKVKE